MTCSNGDTAKPKILGDARDCVYGASTTSTTAVYSVDLRFH
jgi:hypothetical protein